MALVFPEPIPGRFGRFGGRYALEVQIGFLEHLTEIFHDAMDDSEFWGEYSEFFSTHPAPLHRALHLTKMAGGTDGATIWLKREDLAPHGSHNIYNIVGQILLARRMGKTEIIMDCGSARHGVACATICAQLGMKCMIVMGAKDAEDQENGVEKIKSLGASVILANSGDMTLRAAVSQALQTAMQHYENGYLIINGPFGPHPYPLMFRTFQSVIGEEIRVQMREQTGRLPNAVVAIAGGTSPAVGAFHPFTEYPSVKLVGVEAIGSAALCHGTFGVFQGACTHVLQDDDGQILGSTSVAPDLNYPAVGPELASWMHAGRVEFRVSSDQEAAEGFKTLLIQEGILAGLETGYAVGKTVELAKRLGHGKNIVLLVT